MKAVLALERERLDLAEETVTTVLATELLGREH